MAEALADMLQQGLAEIRKIAERAEAEAAKHGEPLQETQNMLEQMGNRLDELETRMEQAALVTPDAHEEPENEQARANEAAFFNWMRHGQAGLTAEERSALYADLPKERRALVEDGTGEILVPEQLESEIYRALPEIAVIRPLATKRRITRGNRIRRRSLTEVTMGWGKLETGTPITESTQLPSDAYQYVEDLYGLTKVGEDELSDTDVALAPIITDSFSRAVAESEDTAFVVGTGHGTEQPEGILTGNVVTRVDAGQAGDITADDMIILSDEVPEQYARNAVYIINRKTRTKLRLLKDNNGQYLWQPSLQAGTPPNFNGYRVYTQGDVPEVPAAGTAADVAIFGDIRSGYRILDRLGLTVQRLNELYAEDGLIGFKAHFRVGGGVIRPEALRVLQVPAA